MTSALLQALLGPEGPPTLWLEKGAVKDASDAARRLFGPALVPGVPALQLFDEESRGKLEAALGQPAARTLEVHVPAPGAPPVPVRLLVVPAGNEAVVMCLGGVRELSGGLYDHLRALMSANDQLTNLTRDLSVRTRELSVAREHLQAINERRDQDAAALSHDIRSPLNAIELQARGLERQATTGALNPEVVRDRAGAIRRTVRVLLALVTNVLDGVRLEAGKLELGREPVSLVDVAKQVVETLQPVAEHAGVRLALLDGVPAQVEGDRVRLFQTLQNLADNAVRFSPKGETVTLALEAEGGKVRCRVMDRGPGVPAEDRERVFERHFQGGRRKGVAGLGLSIARQLVALHGGRLWVEEAPGGGACFVLELPADAPRA